MLEEEDLTKGKRDKFKNSEMFLYGSLVIRGIFKMELNESLSRRINCAMNEVGLIPIRIKGVESTSSSAENTVQAVLDVPINSVSFTVNLKS